jgi:acetyl esterase/lipase
VRVYRPKAAASAPRPGVFEIHGGGFLMGDIAMMDPWCQRVAAEIDAVVVSVEYRLAPEHPFPAALEDCFAAWEFLLSTGVDPGRIVIAGDSAGGNLVVNTALRARDEGLPQPAALLLISPLLDLSFSGGSMRRNDGLDPMFRASSVRALKEYYGTGMDPEDPRLSPIFGRLSGLPASLVLVGSSELLLDDALRFGARVPGARVDVWHDLPHVFPVYRGLSAGDRAIREMAAFIREKTAPATTGAG